MRLTILTLAGAVLTAGAVSAGSADPNAVVYTEDGAIEASLSGAAGDVAAGAKIW